MAGESKHTGPRQVTSYWFCLTGDSTGYLSQPFLSRLGYEQMTSRDPFAFFSPRRELTTFCGPGRTVRVGGLGGLG